MSEIRANTLSDAAGTGPATLTKQSASKLWVNFNGSTIAIRDSYNLASITDNGTGSYDLNTTSAFTDANYSVPGSAWQTGVGFARASCPSASTASAILVYLGSPAGAFADMPIGMFAAHGDLA